MKEEPPVKASAAVAATTSAADVLSALDIFRQPPLVTRSMSLVINLRPVLRAVFFFSRVCGGNSSSELDRNRIKTHKHISHLIASAIDHDLPTPVWRGGRCPHNDIAMRISVRSQFRSLAYLSVYSLGPHFHYISVSLSLHFRHNQRSPA